MGVAGSLLIMVLCGVGYGLCFPPVAARPLAWAILVPAFVVLRRGSALRAALHGAVLAAAGACATVMWLPRTVVVYFEQPLAVGAALFAAVTLVMVVPYYAGFAAFYARAARRPYCGLPLLAGAAWVAGELGRSTLLGGNPWVLAGYTQVGVDRVAQIADLAGVYGIGFVLAAVNVALAEAWIAWRADASPRSGCRRRSADHRDAGRRRPRLRPWRLARGIAPAAGAVAVAVVQGNIDLGSAVAQRALRKQPRALPAPDHRGAARRARAAGGVAGDDHDLLRRRRARLSRLDRIGAAALWRRAARRWTVHGRHRAGAVLQRRLPDRGGRPGAGALRQAASAAVRRGVPFAGVDLMRRNFGRVREFTSGAPGAPLPTVAGPAGVLICNEALYPEDARERVLGGAALLVNLTERYVDGQPAVRRPSPST